MGEAHDPVRLPGTDPLDALREECSAVSQTLHRLTEPDFARPTRCPAWNLRELTEDERRKLGPRLVRRFPLLA